ncbi:type VI secretion system tip protein TssI/VgrG [uncultured Desulfovibrio sp.]|uniref:type VI secretion system Vgr family protein n=1 Tax=uncultured Desulfovibrio sp. TaxID=167968 RepID=UPI00263647D0|nr:type VI secretion system tip protein TssI/VgrG [uncultured Desulfovibrio sp.]
MPTTLTERFRFFSSHQSNEPFHVVGFRGVEGLHQLFDFQIDLVCTDAAVDTGALLAAPCRFEVVRDGDAEPAVFSGYPAAVEQRGFFNGYAYYAVRLRPTFWKLSQIRQSAIFLGKKLEDVLRELMSSQPFFSFPHEFRLTAQDYPAPEFAMQYQETLHDYMCWRMEEQGAYFYFEEKDGTDKVIFADAPQSHSTDDIPRLSYSPASGLEGDMREEVIVSFALTQTPLPRRVVLRSYDWRNPNKPVVGMADVDGNGLGDVYLSNEYVDNDNEANRLAAIRAEELRCRGRLFHGASSAPVLRPGRIFRLDGHYSDPFNRDYLITEVTHEGRQDAFLSLGLGIPLREPGERLYYRNTFTCMEADVPYRPARTAPRSRIPGVLRAFVAGDSSGARAEMDGYGRYKLTFPFDISGRTGGNASCWIRRAQPQVGKDSGLGLPLLPGTEVLVSFVDGNPDLPVIGGALANGETGSISGSGNANFQGLRSPGGNQITINDTDKKQGISLSTPAGSGLTLAAGSTESAILTSANVMQTAGVGMTQLASFGLSQISGYKLNNGVYGYGHAYFFTTFFEALANIGSTAADSLGSSVAGDSTGKESAAWSSTGLKALATALNASASIQSSKGMTPLKYGVSLLAKSDEARSLLQIFPNKAELLSVMVTYLTSLALKSAADITNLGLEAGSAVPKTVYLDALETAMKTLYDKDEKVYAAYNESGRAARITSGCAAYEEVATALVKAIATYDSAIAAQKNAASEAMKTYEASAKEASDKTTMDATVAGCVSEIVKQEQNKAELSACLTALEKAWQDCCGKNSMSDAAYFYKNKIDAVRTFVTDDVLALIPELVSLVLFVQGYEKTNTLGGILLRTDDANITMTARDSIAMHSQRGILRNTRDLPRPASPDMALHHKKYTKTTTDALGKLENYAPGEAPGNIGVLTPFSSLNADDAMAKANAWGLEIQQGHATDFMQEIDALDWRIKDDTTTRRGDYIRKRATFLADTTELEFRRNRWAYQHSEENARITADKQLTLTSGPAAMTLQQVTNAQNIAMLLGTKDDHGQLVLSSQASANNAAATQAIFSPTSLAVTCKPDNVVNPTARLDMGDGTANLSAKEARLILEDNKVCLDGKGSKIVCSDQGISLEPANGKVTLADIAFSGNQITGTRDGILTLGNGAIKITGASATIKLQGDASTRAADQFEQRQDEVLSVEKVAKLLQAMLAGEYDA